MKKQNKQRSEVLTLAWIIRKQNNGLTWGECQAAAWLAVRLRSALYTGPVHFQFTKQDGTTRNATGTLSRDLFTYESKGGPVRENPLLVKYYDLEKQAFRSCRVDRLTGIAA